MKIVVIGGGSSGMLCSLVCQGDVTLIEKNNVLGKKLLITGKGRCNITNMCDVDNLIKNTVSNEKFLYSAYYSFDSYAVMDFFENIGVPLKVERGNRVFPISDKSETVVTALKSQLNEKKVKILTNTTVEEILAENGKIIGVSYNNKILKCDKVILTTGGLSYKSTGSTGDGYKLAQKLGHTVTKTYPSLVPIETVETTKDLEGLTLKNISIKVLSNEKVFYENFGELLFTGNGVSGPLILSASSYIAGLKEKIKIYIDLKPYFTTKELDKKLLKIFDELKNKSFKNCLETILPKKIISTIIEKSGIESTKKACTISKKEREILISVMKEFELTVRRVSGYERAVITKGGINTKEVNSSTMESKLISGLFFAGEILDVDCLTGGYNLQVAFSTGYLAGDNAGR